MRGLVVVLALLAGLADAQTVGSLASSACPLGGCATSGGTVTTTGTLAAGQVALGSGATSVTGDPGLTGVGTGTGFKLGIGTDVFLSRVFAAKTLAVGGGTGGAGDYDGTILAANFNNAPGTANYGASLKLGSLFKVTWGDAESYNSTIDLALSRASSGVLLVEDGSGNARDVQARTGTFGTSVVTPTVVGVGSVLTLSDGVGTPNVLYWGSNTLYPYPANGTDLGSATATYKTGYFGTSLYSPLLSSGVGKSGTNVAGTNSLIQAEPGTGSAAGSSVVFQTPTAGASGTTGQTQATRLTLSEPAVIAAVPVRLAGYTVATLPAGTVGDTAYVSDALGPTFGAAVVGGGAVICPVMYNGSAWVSH